jgi:hypothetical protein
MLYVYVEFGYSEQWVLKLCDSMEVYVQYYVAK